MNGGFAPVGMNRKVPFGRRSMSQAASRSRLGTHHRARCSGLVHASKTRSRGAEKARTIRISRAEGSVTCAPPWLPVGWLARFASTALPLLLHLDEVIVEAGELRLP